MNSYENYLILKWGTKIFSRGLLGLWSWDKISEITIQHNSYKYLYMSTLLNTKWSSVDRQENDLKSIRFDFIQQQLKASTQPRCQQWPLLWGIQWTEKLSYKLIYVLYCLCKLRTCAYLRLNQLQNWSISKWHSSLHQCSELSRGNLWIYDMV